MEGQQKSQKETKKRKKTEPSNVSELYSCSQMVVVYIIVDVSSKCLRNYLIILLLGCHS